MDVPSFLQFSSFPKKFHQGMHTNDYYDSVNRASDNWQTVEQAVEGLKKIATDLAKQAGLP